MSTVVNLRDVLNDDLLIFFEQQNDPAANQMAAFPAREKDAFMAHWQNKILADPNVMVKTIISEGQVAGNVVSFIMDDQREVGYWIGRKFWGKGIATQALAQFLPYIKQRPLYAYAVKNNAASLRVLEKCGFTILKEESEGFTLKLD